MVIVASLNDFANLYLSLWLSVSGSISDWSHFLNPKSWRGIYMSPAGSNSELKPCREHVENTCPQSTPLINLKGSAFRVYNKKPLKWFIHEL